MPYAPRLPSRAKSATLIIHTNGGGTDHGSLYGWFSRPHNTICSHFQVMTDGTIEQYVSVDQQAYAQWDGNRYGVSAETQDDSHPERKLTPEQVASLVKLARWLGCPAKVSPDGKGGGVGWHSLYIDWNRSGHNCPGGVRVKQIHDEILPRLAATTGTHTPTHPHPTDGQPGDSTPPPWPGRLIRQGDSGPDVGRVQARLVAHGNRLRVDHDFGGKTLRALRRFQRNHGLTDDGVVGKLTWRALFT